MRLFVHEIVCAGGLGAVPDSLRAEGRAMLAAAALDFAAAGAEVSTLLTAGAPPIAGIRCEHARPADESAAFDRLVAESDAALVIAPEFDGHLLRRSERILELGRELLGCSLEAIRLAGDKLELARHWRALGVPTPATALASARPADVYPAVLKPRHGAGSLSTMRIERREDWSAAWDELGPTMPEFIVQPYSPGRAASIAFLIAGTTTISLEPALQLLSTDGRFRYLGGRFPRSAADAERARRIGRRALAEIPGLAGYVGVDLVLGAAEADDVAIEINPRLTTSYVGLRRRTRTNLAGVWLDLHAGRPTEPIEWSPDPLEFAVPREQP